MKNTVMKYTKLFVLGISVVLLGLGLHLSGLVSGPWPFLIIIGGLGFSLTIYMDPRAVHELEQWGLAQASKKAIEKHKVGKMPKKTKSTPPSKQKPRAMPWKQPRSHWSNNLRRR